jgi:hypothetical protein
MKSYITEVKDGHHVVRMLTDEEMETLKQAYEFIKDIYERVKAAVIEIWEGIKSLIDSLPPEMKEELLNGQGQVRRVSNDGGHASHRISLRDYPLGGSVGSRNVDCRGMKK